MYILELFVFGDRVEQYTVVPLVVAFTKEHLFGGRMHKDGLTSWIRIVFSFIYCTNL